MNQRRSLNLQQKHRLNNDCEKALIDFPFHDETYTWIEEYKQLFYSITLDNIELDATFYEKNKFTTNNFINQFYFKFNELITRG